MTQPLNKRRVIVFIFEMCYYDIIYGKIFYKILQLKENIFNLTKFYNKTNKVKCIK